MEISSSDEDLDLYTEQVTPPDGSSLRGHKKKISSQRKKTSARRSKRAKLVSPHTKQHYPHQTYPHKT